MITDRIHKVDEFSNLPWGKLDPDKCTRHWGYGWGGSGFGNRVMTITIPQTEDGCDADVWELPAALIAMIEMAQKIAAENVRREIRRTLGLDTG